MKTIRTALTILALALMVASGEAKPISAAEAKAAVTRETKEMKALRGRTGKLTLAYTQMDAAAQPTLYVFNRGINDGFIVASADDEALPLLGYCNEGYFDITAIPDNMRYFLNEYEREINALREGLVIENANPRLNSFTFSEVKPLMGNILWDQKAPFNNKCVEKTSITNCATGCVATATGEIMYYYKYPIAGTGAHSYDDNGVTRQESFTSVIDWENMLPYYNDQSSAAAQKAVSDLLWEIGVASEMKYGKSSSATSTAAIRALLSYFKYDMGARDMLRDYHPLSEWKQMLYTELANRRPISYGGVTSDGGGHQFVIDGNDSDGLFHVNWGWSGHGNGYYSITALKATTEGIGGAGGNGYNYQQSAMIGLQPDQGSRQGDAGYVVVEQCVTDATTVAAGTSVEFDLGRISNRGPFTIDLQAAVGLFVDNTLVAVSDSRNITSLLSWYGMPGPNVVKMTLPELSYSGADVEFHPVYKVSGQSSSEWRLAGGKVPFGTIPARYGGGSNPYYQFLQQSVYHLSVTDLRINKAYAYYPSNLTCRVSNTGTLEFREDVTPVIYNTAGTSRIWECDPINFDVESGETVDMSFPVTINAFPGNYMLRLELADGSVLGASTFTLREEPAAAELTLDAFMMPYGDMVDDNHIVAVARVSNSGGYFNGQLCGLVCNEYGMGMKEYLGITNVEIDGGSYTVAIIDGNSTLPPGDYTLRIGYIEGNTIYTIYGTDDTLSFTITDGTGIEQIMTDGRVFKATPMPATDVVRVNAVNVKELRLYALDGALVAQSYLRDSLNISHIAPGGYVLQCVTADGIYTARIVKE